MERWLVDNVPDLVGADVMSAGKATAKLFADAEKLGIEGEEIAEETGTGSVYETILAAVVHYHRPRMAD
ncbi:DUF768 domain-containing protein [Mesorhizobium amorphae]|uniref:DUF768 domain-containing protein n=1 Tax=Mesorhizobium amorphae CCNWGS0123 TaxID=1082933 RepID=G6YFF4_9HYPH|nr:DUF768 domain-containing protein [Mesorhizobium amorphae]ANT52967.1 hypothetical protein A6B35_25375 [Mesorhizobium amorphae CCNWGS0123]EHH09542.1 hypothetical protein MEA186_23516 [Mesorhizobium amorphae CCNWGS0123]GLR40832.1 hypothetical protein GCM10007880_13480 [Mesorhizobium amorphae]